MDVKDREKTPPSGAGSYSAAYRKIVKDVCARPRPARADLDDLVVGSLQRGEPFSHDGDSRHASFRLTKFVKLQRSLFGTRWLFRARWYLHTNTQLRTLEHMLQDMALLCRHSTTNGRSGTSFASTLCLLFPCDLCQIYGDEPSLDGCPVAEGELESMVTGNTFIGLRKYYEQVIRVLHSVAFPKSSPLHRNAVLAHHLATT